MRPENFGKLIRRYGTRAMRSIDDNHNLTEGQYNLLNPAGTAD
jgi:hypothetical protein